MLIVANIFVVTYVIAAQSQQTPNLFFSCDVKNDLYQVVTKNVGPLPRYDSPAQAVAAAEKGAGVVILADGYPASMTKIEASVLEEAKRKQLHLYIEYPEKLPDLAIEPPVEFKKERGVVTSRIFAERLQPMRIVTINGCWYVPVQVVDAHIVLAKVAGVDTAVFGLKDTPSVPILFDHPRGNLLVATTKLSHFVTGRYMPTEAWRTIWQTILARLQPGMSTIELRWIPTVYPSYGRDESLPATIEQQALRRSTDWIFHSRVLRHPDWSKEVLDRSLHYNTVRDMPAADWPRGDGSFGILEGFSSTIRVDGTQPMRYAVRDDCTMEMAMMLAFDAVVNKRSEHAKIASNLLEYILSKSGLSGGPRGDPKSPSYGLFGWALDKPGAYYGDDNARALLALGAAAALMKDSRWDEAMLRCILANFRTTGSNGFRIDCVNEEWLQKNGWQAAWNGRPEHYSPHFQAWIWCCYLWVYQQTRFAPLLERTQKGMKMMMEAYPAKWQWCLRSGTMERSRLLLALAWLIRVDDTPEHRMWLKKVAGDLLALQDASGAIREVIGDGGPGIHSNAEYATRETSIIQTDGDPVSDMLYSCNFALIGLHEAAAVTGDPLYLKAEDKLAEFLCRIQIRSEKHPELDGAWYRAFNYRSWEYWASNADWEWGPWCTETGWTQPWIAGTFALRQQKISLWELTQKVDFRKHFDRLRREMLPDELIKVPVTTTK